MLLAAGCAGGPGGIGDPQPQARSEAGIETGPAAPSGGSGTAAAGAAGEQGAESGASAGDGQPDASPESADGTGPADGRGDPAAGAAPGDGAGTAGGGTLEPGGARNDGGGTPPTGSGAAGGTGNAGGATGSADPAPAPPITPPGPRFPEPLGVSLTRLAELPAPLAVAFRTQEPASLYVALRHGEVVRLRGESGRADSSAILRRDANAVLDMSARVDTRGEMGLLGLTFSPAGDRLYTSSVNRQQVSELWEWPVAADGSVDAARGRLVLTLEQPFANHNGGDVTFGPDGYLYLGFGDGGGGGDPLRAGQDPHDWLGTILRIDPRVGPGGEPYTVPAGNPFADGVSGAPEVWVWGARNPWRFSFDRANGDLWVSDVGQDLLEEINRLPAADGGAGRGANLGWSDYEGSNPFWSNTEPPGHVRPTVEYRHGDDARCSVTGGYVYRGSRLPGLGGVYLYSDFCDGTLWGYNDVAGAHPIHLASGAPPKSVLSFGQGPDGEIYVLTGDALWRLEPA
ncbi:MAG: PQQ-dependent sugar dehydrogenase [bacterium]|nr:PQQ-dependent sugar dehydrogenase [bacterium]